MNQKGAIGIIIVILVLVIVIAGGYYVYLNYFAGEQQEVKVGVVEPSIVPIRAAVAATKGPKDTYVEYLNKAAQAKTIEDLMNITADYGNFATLAEKQAAIAKNVTQLQAMTDMQKAQQFKMMKNILAVDPGATYKETITGNNAVVTITDPNGGTLSVSMVKVGNVWTLPQQ